MRKELLGSLRALSHCSRGNALLLVGLSMPILIGAAGFGLDISQWYAWKREMQYAVDQAAIAAAWARTNSSSASTYITRGTQEFNANLSSTSGSTTTPSITLVNYSGGTSNSVLVHATMSRELPFSSILMHRAVTIYASAQATFASGQTYTTCMLALDPTASGAFTLGGNAHGSALCGFGALSTSPTAMVKNGNPDAQAGTLVSNGGIDSGYAANGTIHANVGGLTNPYASIPQPVPASSPARTYSCPTASPATTTTTANVTTRTTYTYSYKKGANAGNATAYNYTPAKPTSTTTVGPTNQTVPNGTTAGTVNGTPTTTTTQIGGSGNAKIFEVQTTTTSTTYANVVVTTVPANDGIARLSPGTYPSINIACQTIFSPGIYVVTGSLDFGQNQSVTGSDLMFVLTNPGNMHINSNSNLNLSGITKATLQSVYGYSAADAATLAGMLIYDKNSTDQWKVNGNSNVVMNGLLYMPSREVWFNGNSSVGGSCLMIAAARITFTGNNDISSFCVPSSRTSGIQVGGGTASVKLVA